MTDASSRVILPEPPAELKQLSDRLTGRIRARMQNSGSLSFRDFMEMALYEPGTGYYSAGLHKFGAAGDFVTAPELGQLFAACLARQIDEVGSALGDFDVLELGAGTGRLAAGILNRLQQHAMPRRYRILERSADLVAEQRRTLEREAPAALDRVEWLSEPPRTPWQGVLLANEVIDALAVERFMVTGDGLMQLCVRDGEDGFQWHHSEAGERLSHAVENIPAAIRATWPDAYRSEINPDLAPWFRSVTGQLQRGVALCVDYGYPRHEYYRSERCDGTLICHYRHRAHDDPFWWPGLQDITAFVDFTALAEAADDCGMTLTGYTNQAMFLIGCGLEQLMAGLEDLPERERYALAAEAKQLTLPGMMGERFQVMGLTREFDTPLSGFGALDLCHRL